MSEQDSETEQISDQQISRTFSEEESNEGVCMNSYDKEALQIEAFSIVNSTGVQLGSNYYYNGPVTIQHTTVSQSKTITLPKNTEKTSNKKEDTAWQHQLCLISKKGRYVTPGILIAGLLTTFIFLTTIIVQTGSEDNSNSSDQTEYTKPSNDSSDLNTNRTRIYERSVWTHRKPSAEIDALVTPVPVVMISHSATQGCSTFDQCTRTMRQFQEYHMDTMEWEDIGYNFMIGGDGRIYEGRGWDKMGSHTYGYNRNSTGICIIGNFDISEPTVQQIDATHKLIELGVQLGKISPDYRLLAQKQVQSTQSPGKHLFALMIDWPHFGFQSSP